MNPKPYINPEPETLNPTWFRGGEFGRKGFLYTQYHPLKSHTEG